MGMMLEVLSPTVQHGEEAYLRPQVLGVCGDGLQSFGRGLEQDAIDYFFILVSDRGDLFRNGEHDMKVLGVEQFCLAVLDPLRPCQTLAFRAVSIPAAIERIPFIAALIAAFQVAAESSRTAQLDGGHDAPLCYRHRRAMLLPIRFSVAAEHIRHFQLRTIHGSPSAQKS
jgi:hypothetical protein